MKRCSDICIATSPSLLCFPGKSREWAQSKSQTSFSLLPFFIFRHFISARTRRINDSVMLLHRLPEHPLFSHYMERCIKKTPLEHLVWPSRYKIQNTPYCCVTASDSRLCDGFTRRTTSQADFQAAEPSRFCLDSVPPRVIHPESITDCQICHVTKGVSNYFFCEGHIQILDVCII